MPTDLIPRVIPAAEWRRLAAGLAQRVRALDAFLADVYGPRRALRDGVVPSRLVLTGAGVVREMAGRPDIGPTTSGAVVRTRTEGSRERFIG